MKMGSHFIEKSSRYPMVANKIFKIYKNDKSNFELIVKLSDYLKTNRHENIYDEEIVMIIYYLSNNKLNINIENLSEKDLINIENYIIQSSKGYKNSKYEPCSYIQDKNTYLDNIIDSKDNIDEVKDIFYQRYFYLKNDEVNMFLEGYAKNWDSVREYSKSLKPDMFIAALKIVSEVEDINVLKELYKKFEFEFTFSDYLEITGIMKSAYNKAVAHDIQDKQNGTSIELDINGTKVNATELEDNFGIFIHSTCAYGSMQMINDNYHDSWNLCSNTANHGICTCYITNSSYGTPAVTDNGVIFGFTNIDEKAIPLMAPYDLVTINAGYTIQSMHNPFFARLNTISDFTRHTHNEISLERRLDGGNGALRQPDCIIIFEDMDDNIKQNSLRAYNDFKENGIELKVIYIDRVKIAKMEASKIKEDIEKYKNTFDFNVLEDIINRYESNICSCDFLAVGKEMSKNLFDKDELFMTKEIEDLLNSTLDYISTIDNIEEKNSLIVQFKNIMDKEQYKFDLIDDSKGRAHKFLLYSDEMKAKIAQIENTEVSNVKVVGG